MAKGKEKKKGKEGDNPQDGGGDNVAAGTIDKKPSDTLSQKTRVTARSSQKNKMQSNDLVDKDDAIFEDNNVMVQIQGRINLGAIPRYRQRGEITMLRSNNFYLGISVLNADKIQPPETRAVVNTFVAVEWGGQIKKSATIPDNYKPSFNEEFFFEIPVKCSVFDDKAKKIKLLREELLSNNSVSIDLWLDGGDGTNDNLGNCKFLFSELLNGAKDTKLYLDEDIKKEVRYESRTIEDKKKLTTGLNDAAGELLLQMWFLPDITDDLDMREFGNQKEDKFPPELQKSIKYQHYELDWHSQLASNFKQAPLPPARMKNFNYFMVKDQYSKLHLLSLFVDKYSLYECKFED